MPEIIFKSVDFPEPEKPITPRVSPFFISKEILFKTNLLSNFLISAYIYLS